MCLQEEACGGAAERLTAPHGRIPEPMTLIAGVTFFAASEDHVKEPCRYRPRGLAW